MGLSSLKSWMSMESAACPELDGGGVFSQELGLL